MRGSRADIIGQLPASEQECIRQGLGEAAFSQFMERGINEDTSPEEDAFSSCLSHESLARLQIGGLTSVLGELSGDTVACMLASLADVDLRSFTVGGEQGLEAEQGMALFLGMLLCLNDEEAARADALGFFGPQGGISIADVRCVVQHIDLTLLAQLFAASGSFELPSQELLDALSACDIDFDELSGPDDEPIVSLEQVECVLASIDSDIMEQIASGRRIPTEEELRVLRECGVTLFEGRGDPDEFRVVIPGGFELTEEQVVCLVTTLGPAFRDVLSGSRLPSLQDLQAFPACGIELGGG